MPKKLTNHSRPRALAVLVHLDRGTGQSKTFYRETNQMIICLMICNDCCDDGEEDGNCCDAVDFGEDGDDTDA